MKRAHECWKQNVSSIAMKCTRVLYDVTAFILMSLNIAYLTMEYMQYRVDTDSAPYFPVVLDTPKVSICFDLIELIQLKNETIDWQILNSHLTMDQVFSLMPPVDKMIESCVDRSYTLDSMIQVNYSNECVGLLQLMRYKMQGYVCYRFEIIEPAKYSYHTIINSLYRPRELYGMTLRASQ